MSDEIKNNNLDSIIQEVAKELGFEIYESSSVKRNGKLNITVRIDSGKNVSHGDCIEYSRLLNERLDGNETYDRYLLEVSSPGLNRDVRTLEQYGRFVGEPVKVIALKEDGTEVLKGKLLSVEGDIVTIKDERGDISVSYSNIVSGNLDY